MVVAKRELLFMRAQVEPRFEDIDVAVGPSLGGMVVGGLLWVRQLVTKQHAVPVPVLNRSG